MSLVFELYSAAKQDDLERVKSLIEKGANVNATFFEAPLFYRLSIEGHEELIKLLIEEGGANVNAANADGATPLHWVCKNGYIEAAKLLIKKGANVNATISNHRWTPLHWACEKGLIKVAKLLIENGANLNATDIDGLTPLNLAYLHNHIELAKWLISRLLLKNLKEEEPDFIKHQDLSAYWKEQILKIKYLPQEEIIGGKTLTETILNKISSGKSDTLVSHSFHQLFKSLNSEAIKSQASKIDQWDTTMSSPKLS